MNVEELKTNELSATMIVRLREHILRVERALEVNGQEGAPRLEEVKRILERAEALALAWRRTRSSEDWKELQEFGEKAERNLREHSGVCASSVGVLNFHDGCENARLWHAWGGAVLIVEGKNAIPLLRQSMGDPASAIHQARPAEGLLYDRLYLRNMEYRLKSVESFTHLASGDTASFVAGLFQAACELLKVAGVDLTGLATRGRVAIA